MNTFNTKSLLGNPILNADSYKLSHYKFEDEGTTYMKSYVEARIGGIYNETIFFGLQAFIKEYMNVRITQGMIEQACEFVAAHGNGNGNGNIPFNRKGWEYIVNNLGGRLPLKIKAVREGSLVPVGNALVTVENTDPNCAWLVSYFETAILRAIWYGVTVATRSFNLRKIIQQYLAETGDTSELDFKFIDFGARGVTSKESAGIGGAAHQTSFMGTDNIVGIATIMEYYETNEMPSFSIPASEHTVTILWTKEREKEFFKNAVQTFASEGNAVSVVSDTYSMENALRMWGEELKEDVLAMGGTVVIRPDSGDPTEQVLKAVSTLDKYYGSTVNEKGFKLLHPAVRVIQGDGVTLEKVEEILETLKQNGYSANNVTFGCGGYLLQDMTRDSLRFAMKGCYAIVNGEERNISKTVVTDATKVSKAGNLTLVKNHDGEYQTVTMDEMERNGYEEQLDTVFFDGTAARHEKFSNIRKRVASH